MNSGENLHLQTIVHGLRLTHSLENYYVSAFAQGKQTFWFFN